MDFQVNCAQSPTRKARTARGASPGQPKRGTALGPVTIAVGIEPVPSPLPRYPLRRMRVLDAAVDLLAIVVQKHLPAVVVKLYLCCQVISMRLDGRACRDIIGSTILVFENPSADIDRLTAVVIQFRWLCYCERGC